MRMYVLPKIDSEPFEVVSCCLYLPFLKIKTFLSIDEDPSSEKVHGKLFKLIERNISIFSVGTDIDKPVWKFKGELVFFKSAVSLCSLDKQVHAMNDTACFYHSRS